MDVDIVFGGNEGYEMIVRQLLDRGADVNKADEDGMTPLHLASYNDKSGEASSG